MQNDRRNEKRAMFSITKCLFFAREKKGKIYLFANVIKNNVSSQKYYTGSTTHTYREKKKS